MGLLGVILRFLIASGLLGPAGPTQPAPDPYQVFIEQHADLIAAIEQTESRGNPHARNATEDAVGILQIRPIMVEEVNRLLGTNRYTMADRWCPEKSREMFACFSMYWILRYRDTTDEGIARRWNGGPRGHVKDATTGYWTRVQGALPPQADGACSGGSSITLKN